MNDGYRLVIDGLAFKQYLNCRVAPRRYLNDLFASLALEPFQTGNFQEVDETGRTVEVLVKKRYAISFWADHAVRELRVVRIEHVNI